VGSPKGFKAPPGHLAKNYKEIKVSKAKKVYIRTYATANTADIVHTLS